MKLTLTSAALALIASNLSWDVATAKKLSNFRADQQHLKTILANSRKLADEEEEEEEEEEYAFLQNYQIKFLKCLAGEQYVNEEGEKEYSSILFRLCPVSGDCDADNAMGCSDGYGDYVIGINSYLDAMIDDEDRRRKLADEEEEEFRLQEYIECREADFEQEEEEDEDGEDRKRRRRKLDEEQGYFIGPACTEDGSDVRLALFDSDYCKNESEESFYDLSNGQYLPFADGGVVGPYCAPIYAANENGEYEMKNEYLELYEQASGCESKMEYFDENNGKDESKCEYISEFVKTKSGGAGKFFLWLIVILIVVGGIYFAMQYQKNSKDSKTEGLAKSDGVAA